MSTALRRAVDALITSRLLVGDQDEPVERLQRRVRIVAMAVAVVSNVIGIATVVTVALLALPKPDDIPEEAVLVNLAVAAGYVPIALAVGVIWGTATVERGRHGTRSWLARGDHPTEAQRARTLRAPLRLMTIQLILWTAAAALFAAVNTAFSPLLSLGIGLTVLLGGVTTSTAAYVAGELALRPITSRALGAGEVGRRGVPGLATRWLLTWAFGTGAPVVGLLVVGVVALTPVEIEQRPLAIAVVVLCTITLVFGALVTVLAAYATAHPIASIRRGLRLVGEGDLSASVPIWDTTEIGALQRGFNDMVEGLRERERVRDLFGRQVGADVAKRAIDGGIDLDGELVDISVLFVDIVGSTALASRTEPRRVVQLLNRFLTVVVEEVEQAGGWINKFEGDAALAIFGAPSELDDASGRSLRAARRICDRLARDVPEMSAAIGVATGTAVAGHIGTERRFEYTVIGDPVNEAARLTELAKSKPGMVAASWQAVERATPAEAGRWVRDGAVELRGRSQTTIVAIRDDSDADAPVDRQSEIGEDHSARPQG